MSPEPKETRTARAERLKKEKNPWECLEEIRQFAQSGYESVSPGVAGELSALVGYISAGRWRGSTRRQRRRRSSPSRIFMLRIRVPNGLLFSHQLRTIADLANQYARGVADITVRHNIQLHWISDRSSARNL